MRIPLFGPSEEAKAERQFFRDLESCLRSEATKLALGKPWQDLAIPSATRAMRPFAKDQTLRAAIATEPREAFRMTMDVVRQRGLSLPVSVLNFLKSKKPLPASDAERFALMRNLVVLRLKLNPSDPGHAGLEATGMSAAELPDEIISGLPEAAIVRISEQYLAHRDHGISDEQTIEHLNQTYTLLFLATLGVEIPMMSQPYSLEKYIEHYFEHTNPGGCPIPRSFIAIGVQEVRRFYGR